MPNNNTRRNAKREAELFQNVLGLTGEVGYKNASRVGKQLSKRSASNYLTTTRRRLNQAEVENRREYARALPGYREALHGSRLHYAILKANPEYIQRLIRQAIDINIPGYMGQTPLALAINTYLIFNKESRDRRFSAPQRRQIQNQMETLLNAIELLLARGAIMSVESVKDLWSNIGDTNQLETILQRFPQFMRFSFEHSGEIMEDLDTELDILQDDVGGMHNNNEEHDNFLRVINFLNRRIRELTRFIETYDADAGTFTFQPAPPAAAAAPPLGLLQQLAALGINPAA